MPFASADDSGSAHVGFFGALGITFQQSRRIVPAARRNRMQRHTTIQPKRFVRAAEIVLAEVSKAEPAKDLLDSPGRIPRIAPLSGRERSLAQASWGTSNALSGSFTSDNSTGAPSGTPATKRKCFSRSTGKSANNSSSMTKVRLPRAVFGCLNLMAYFFVCSSARWIVSVLLTMSRSDHHRARPRLAGLRCGGKAARVRSEMGRL
jgi:hypothetical protein